MDVWAQVPLGVAVGAMAGLLTIMAATSSPAAVAALGCGVAVANYSLDRQRLAGAPGGRKRALLASVGVALVVLVFVGSATPTRTNS